MRVIHKLRQTAKSSWCEQEQYNKNTHQNFARSWKYVTCEGCKRYYIPPTPDKYPSSPKSVEDIDMNKLIAYWKDK